MEEHTQSENEVVATTENDTDAEQAEHRRKSE